MMAGVQCIVNKAFKNVFFKLRPCSYIIDNIYCQHTYKIFRIFNLC